MKHIHRIGKGATTGTEIKVKQWYIWFGYVPCKEVNINLLSGDADNLEIETKGSWLNWCLFGFWRVRNVIVRI